MKINIDIGEFIKNFSNECTKAQLKTFEKGEIITTYLVNRNQLCFIVEGQADLIRYESNGTQNIIEHLSNNDLFGEIFYQLTTNNELFVLAKKKTSVLFYSYDNFHKKCKKNCKFHDVIGNNLPDLILDKFITLNIRIEVLSQRSIRDKLLTYFNILSARSLNKTFLLPFSLTDLADYLSIDRSAMMRELKSLQEDKIIKKDKNKITMII